MRSFMGNQRVGSSADCEAPRLALAVKICLTAAVGDAGRDFTRGYGRVSAPLGGVGLSQSVGSWCCGGGGVCVCLRVFVRGGESEKDLQREGDRD